MSTRYFKSLVRFAILHEYYSSGKCDEFSLIPTDDTQKFLRNQHMKFVPDSTDKTSSFTLGYEAVNSGGTPFIAFPDNAVLSFFMKLKEPNLLNVTALDTRQPGQIYYYYNPVPLVPPDNHPANTLIYQTELPYLVSKRFPFSFQAAGAGPYAADTLQIVNVPTNTVVKTISISANDSGLYSENLDLSSLPEGRYNIRPVAHLSDTKKVYISESHYRESGIFAAIDFVKDTSADRDWNFASVPQEVTLQLKAQSQIWKYWLINNTGGGLSIADDSTNPGAEPAPYNFPFVFSAHNSVGYSLSAEDTKMEAYLNARYAPMVARLFVSSRAGAPYSMVRHERPRLKLSLSDTDPAVPVKIIKNLPNPSMANPKPEIVLCVTPQEALPNI